MTGLPNLFNVRNELLMSGLFHLFYQQLGVAEDVPERRAQVMEKIGREHVLNPLLDRFGQLAHEPFAPPEAVLLSPPSSASIFPSSRTISIGFVS